MFKKININDLTIVQYLLIFISISLFIMYLLFDKDLILSKDIKKAYEGKNVLYLISNNYDKYKKEFNIEDIECNLILNKPYVYEPRETILISNDFKTKEQIDKFILEYPKTYKELNFFYNQDISLNENLSKCLKKDKNKQVIEYILENLDKNKSNFEKLLNENKNFSCFNFQSNKNNRVSKMLGYSIIVDKESYFIKKLSENSSMIYNIKFCEEVK